MAGSPSGNRSRGHGSDPSLRGWRIRFPGAGDRARDLETAAAAALAGGRAVSAYYGSDDLGVRDKGDGDAPDEIDDPVTRADRASNEAIVASLGSRTADPVLSEEASPPADRAAGGRLWVVDPLDGTKEFIARIAEFSVMVGLAERGRAVLGAVYQPAARRLFLGCISAGAWVVEDPEAAGYSSSLRIRGPTARPLRLIRSRSHPDPALIELESRLAPVRVVVSGSVGVKCATVATGDADLYVHPVAGLKEWDTCAPEAVLRGAGGRVTDCATAALRYGKSNPAQSGGIFCGRPDVHRRVVPIVREVASHLFAT